MDKEQLTNFLKHHYHKQKTIDLAKQVESSSISMDDVLQLCFQQDKQIAFRAAWLLEYAEIEAPAVFKPLVHHFLKLYKTTDNPSVQRHFSKIGMRLVHRKWKDFYQLTTQDLSILLEPSFDWLINPKVPVAVKCNCLDIIYALSDEQDWTLEELKVVLQDFLTSSSPALISRAKRVLYKIKRKEQKR
ncbi:hypothetical protein [Pedobacter glucosidilyticus]|uniref:hypothetical protein n=1 Tax=Pedobacter glucosidilyticus TaxID=1122941 RepID=UPI00042A8AC9|nr:hypothetical protein [Pedobacter glucosidilyticus]